MKFFNMRALNKKKLALFAIFLVLINYLSLTSYPIRDTFNKMSLQSPWVENIMCSNSTASYIYTLYVFIFSGFIYADSLVLDKESGLLNIIASKIDYKTYIVKTLVYNFFIAGVFAVIPAIVNLCLWFTVRTNVPLVYFNIMNMHPDALFLGVFLKSHLAFYILLFIKIFLCGGIIATFAIFINTSLNNKYIGMVVTFIMDILLSLILVRVMPNVGVSLFIFVSSLMKPDILTLIIFLVFLLPSIIYFALRIKERDIL